MALSYTLQVLIPYKKGGHPLSPDLFLIGMAPRLHFPPHLLFRSF